MLLLSTLYVLSPLRGLVLLMQLARGLTPPSVVCRAFGAFPRTAIKRNRESPFLTGIPYCCRRSEGWRHQPSSQMFLLSLTAASSTLPVSLLNPAAVPCSLTRLRAIIRPASITTMSTEGVVFSMGRSKATTRKGRHSCEPSAETVKGGRFHTPRRKGRCSTEHRLTLHGVSGDAPRSIKHSPFRQGFASLAAEPRKTYKSLLNYTIKKGIEPLCTRLSTEGSGEYRRI